MSTQQQFAAASASALRDAEKVIAELRRQIGEAATWAVAKSGHMPRHETRDDFLRLCGAVFDEVAGSEIV